MKRTIPLFCGRPLASKLLSFGYLIWCHQFCHHISGSNGTISVFFITLQSNCSEIQPHMSLDIILWNPIALDVEYAEAVLGTSHPLIGGFLVPFGRIGVVLWYPHALVVQSAEAILSNCQSLICSFLVPLGRLAIVLRKSLTLVLEIA